MTRKYLWRGVLVVLLSVALVAPAEAQTGSNKIVSNGTIVGAIVGIVAGLVVVTLVAVHYSSKKKTITGCVSSEGNTMSLTDEKDKQTYTLAGNTSGLKPGDRMTLQGKKGEPNGTDKTLVWETKKVVEDLGACHP